jgi:hypothetical protein
VSRLPLTQEVSRCVPWLNFDAARRETTSSICVRLASQIFLIQTPVCPRFPFFHSFEERFRRDAGTNPPEAGATLARGSIDPLNGAFCSFN